MLLNDGDDDIVSTKNFCSIVEIQKIAFVQEIRKEIHDILLPDTEAELLRRTLPTSPDFGFVERPRGWKKDVTYLGPKNYMSSQNYIT